MEVKQRILRLCVVLIGLCLLIAGSPAFAQGNATPIQIGQNATGVISADASTAQFALTSTGNESATIQVLALSPGFTPRFSVLNPAGIEILTIANSDGKASLTGNAAFDDAGVYTIVIAGENSSTGQFVLSLQPGAPLPEPVSLTVNQPVTNTVGSQTPVQLYRFDTTSLGAVTVTILSQQPDAGPLVTVYDESDSKTIASSGTGVVGAAYQLPAAGHVYHVELHASGAGDTPYSICLGTCGSSPAGGNGSDNVVPTPTPNIVVPPAQTPEAAAAGCTVTPSINGSANLRSGPGMNYAILSGLPVGQTAQVLGVWTGGGWYEVNMNGIVLWVGGSVVSLSGDCSALPKVDAPTNAPLAPTKAPTNPPAPVRTPEIEPSDTPEQSLPDLTTINLQLFTDNAGNYTFTVTILNNGTAPLTPDQTFAILACYGTLDNCNEYDDMSFSLQPGETTQFSGDVPYVDGAESRSVTVTLDGRSQIAESNEGNNDAFASLPG